MLRATALINVALSAAFFTAAHLGVRGWRGIIPLHSTRSDVERLLGAPTKADGYATTYKLRDQSVFIEYSSGPCNTKSGGGWNVPTDTVIRIRVTLASGPKFSDIRVDESKYKRAEDPHIPGYVYYYNEEEGARITVYHNEVISTEYGATKKDSHLRCPHSGN